ncbi:MULTISPECIES: hypothetical protein [unclassified Enterococcus]|uniref:hypothetical protein n=1 Tax=unclassified Enterococcus TaxID=2608891 RepID=UPI00155369A8|nr:MULTISPECIES: hypothetical protein [unclassified Enterococcus]MBS7577159.1 hypothetical protein [Enterococcus sp. MMGLQ5-2]MBS7584394.1 hypothetical protein [Enterococcus sp. MMGLQ5-1]NPD12249.1 hypothetical protein [Enterococcus sp. MMGLQ5-1]NPD36993.1 hypothetical protein [Enterococcus sp. MMGLQ5-2]
MSKMFNDVYKYLTQLNQQFDGKLIDQEDLDDLLLNWNDMRNEEKELNDSVQYLLSLPSFSETWDELINENSEELKNGNELHKNILEIYSNWEELYEIIIKINKSYLRAIHTPLDERVFYDFGEASITKEVENDENMEMVSKDGMDALRKELFELRKYKAASLPSNKKNFDLLKKDEPIIITKSEYEELIRLRKLQKIHNNSDI